MNSKPQTPLERLTAEKNKIKQLTKEQEIKLNEHIVYVQKNAGSLLLSLVSSMLFAPSAKKENNPAPTPSGEQPETTSTGSLSLADFIPVGKLLLPVAWDIAKPILLSWGIKKATKIASGLFTRKKV